MTDRTNEEISENIKQVLDEYVAPVVAAHGGVVNFSAFSDGTVLLEMSGACSGCAGSTATLKHGIEQLLKEMVPEVDTVEGFDDPFSSVDPFYAYSSHPFIDEWETIEITDLSDDESDNK